GGIALSLLGLAGVALGTMQPEKSAQLFGAAYAALDALGTRLYGGELINAERTASTGSQVLGEEAWGAGVDEGRAMPLEDAISLTNALLSNPQDAEDVTQEVFLRVYKALPSYNPERAAMRTWLARVTVNACQTHRRRNFLRNLLNRIPDAEDEEFNPVDDSSW